MLAISNNFLFPTLKILAAFLAWRILAKSSTKLRINETVIKVQIKDTNYSILHPK